MRLVLFRPAVAVLLLAALAACQSTLRTHPIPTFPSDRAIAEGRPVRVTLNDGRQLTLSTTHVVGDSLIGHVGRERVRIATAIADVRSIDEESPPSNASVAATAGKTVAIIAGVVLLLMIKVYDDALGG